MKKRNGELAGRTFAISAIAATIVPIIGEQAVLVVWSPQYFLSLGEWLWNLFVSVSFLMVLTTLYGLTGGVAWRTVEDLVAPFDIIRTTLKKARQSEEEDKKAAAKLIAMAITLVVTLLFVFLTQKHFAIAYNNKSLAAVVFIILIMLASPFILVTYQWSKKAASFLLRFFQPLAKGRLYFASLILFALIPPFLMGIYLSRNLHLFDAIDIRPFAILALFLTAQIIFYKVAIHPGVREATQGLTNLFSVGGWLLLVMMPLIVITIFAYPTQPHAASILKNHSPISRYMIKGIQNISDADNDGFSSMLRGGDCDDTNSAIHPMAEEIPENGIDDDCFAGDAAFPKKKKRVLSEALQYRIDSLKEKYNVVIIGIDAVRADSLGFMGYHRNTTPELDAFAMESVTFLNAFSQASNTPQSIPSFISGMYPTQIHWDRYTNFPKVKNQTHTMVEIFKINGYFTMGVFSYWYFERRNLKRGADIWDTTAFRTRGHTERYPSDDLVTDNAINHLKRIEDKIEKPLFLWMHYFDPHFLYARHRGIDFGNSQRDLYDGELRFSSKQVGRFLDYFKKTKWYENSVIVIMSDHGEEFGEHGGKYHGGQLYNETTHVPLMIHSPILAADILDTPVGLIDVAPTLYELTGVETGYKPQGRSLMPMILQGSSEEHDEVYMEKLAAPSFPYSLQAIIKNRWKLLYRANEAAFELYDLENDPDEQRNVSKKLPERLEQMKKELNDFRLRRLNNHTGWYDMRAKSR